MPLDGVIIKVTALAEGLRGLKRGCSKHQGGEMARRVWFELDVGGEPKFVKPVCLAAGQASAAHLLEAVKAKCPKALYHVDSVSDELLVYKNWSARQADQPTPLEPNASLEGLGESTQEPLVVVTPKQQLKLACLSPTESLNVETRGEERNLALTTDDILSLLVADVIDMSAIGSHEEYVPLRRFNSRFVGRDEVIQEAAECFSAIIDARSQPGMTLSEPPVLPVCSGITGIGKGRLLREHRAVLEKMGLRNAVSVIVPDLWWPSASADAKVTLEAAFSWRVLCSFFLDGNSKYGSRTWIQSRVPANGANLTFKMAIEVIYNGLVKASKEEVVPGPFHLFLGVGRLDMAYRGAISRRDERVPSEWELANVIGEFLSAEKSCGVVVLPLLTATKWPTSLLDVATLSSPAAFVAKRLSMPLLTTQQIFRMVEDCDDFVPLLGIGQVIRDLIVLGGVPGWIAKYVSTLGSHARLEFFPSWKAIQASFDSVHRRCVQKHLVNSTTSAASNWQRMLSRGWKCVQTSRSTRRGRGVNW